MARDLTSFLLSVAKLFKCHDPIDSSVGCIVLGTIWLCHMSHVTAERPFKTRGDASGYLAFFLVTIEYSLLFFFFCVSFCFCFTIDGVGAIYPSCTHRSCIVAFDTRTPRTYHTRNVSPTPELRSSDRWSRWFTPGSERAGLLCQCWVSIFGTCHFTHPTGTQLHSSWTPSPLMVHKPVSWPGQIVGWKHR
jgi:hypothetical protein